VLPEGHMPLLFDRQHFLLAACMSRQYVHVCHLRASLLYLCFLGSLPPPSGYVHLCLTYSIFSDRVAQHSRCRGASRSYTDKFPRGIRFLPFVMKTSGGILGRGTRDLSSSLIPLVYWRKQLPPRRKRQPASWQPSDTMQNEARNLTKHAWQQ